MSTHFHPRPPSATPSSPVRPSTAQSTIRAVAPSPPDSLEKAFPNTRAKEWTPARPRSEGFVGFGTPLFDGKEEIVDGDGKSAKREGLRRAGRARSTSPKKKRPQSSPAGMLSFPDFELEVQDGERAEERDAHDEQKEDGHAAEPQDESDDEQEPDCPDTPTPMTRSQKRAAYIPLGAGIPAPRQNQRSGVAAPPRRPPPSRDYTNANTTEGRRYAQSPLLPSTLDTSQQHSSTTLIPAPLAPRPRNPPPLHGPGKHISVSAQSTLSANTVASQRSIFSTPGRDELERKKALVEEDEGPFARAVSVADLRERRKEVGGASGGEKRKGKKGNGKWRGNLSCGLGGLRKGSCCVM